MSENHVYSIDLDLKANQASKQTLKELQSAFENSGDSIDELNKTYKDLADNTTDILELNKQYNKVIEKSIAEKDKLIDRLKAEQVKILANKDLTDEQKDAKLKLLDASIKSFEVEKKILKSKSKEVQLETKMKDLVKADLQSLKDKVKEQFKFISALKTTEGRYNAIKKAAAGAAKAGLNIAKFGVKAAGGVLALGGAASGMAIGAAQSVADKENALKSLKSGIDPSVVDAVYVKGGGDWESIVAAVNNLSSVTKDNTLLVQGAVLELKNPGVGKLLLSTSKQNPENIDKLKNAIDQIKRQTGTQDMSAALEASTKARTVTTGVVSQTEYVQAYSALAQHGLDEDKINRIIRDVSKQSGNFIDNLNNVNLAKYVQGQDKIRLSNIKLGLEKLDLSKGAEKSAAESIVEKLREFELKKNELLVKLLPLIEPMLKELDKILNGPTIEKIAKGLINFISKAVPILVDILTKLEPHVSKLINWIANLVGSNAQNSNTVGATAAEFVDKIFSNLLKGIDAIANFELPWKKNLPGGMQAQGGLVTAPSLCGEAGPELVIPLDNSRAGRASQIINNFNTNQSFNVAANQRTELSFSQVVGQNRFIKRYAGL